MRVAIAAALMGLFVMTASAGVAIPDSGAESSEDVIVVFHDDVDNPAQAAADLTRAHGGELRFVYHHAIKGFSATLTTAAVTALERNPQVAFINENRPVEAFEDDVPTGVSRIDGPVAHSNGVIGEGVRVAIIDTGIDSNHEDLPSVDFTSGYNCIDPGALPEDDQGHGTHVAGTVAAADNGLGVIGVAPAATLVPVKVLNSSGSGTWEEVICGIDHITALNTTGDTSDDIHVANMSLGGSGSHDGTTCAEDTSTDAMYQAICSAIDSGATFVVAAGNDSTNADGFVPAAYPEVITVSAYSDTNGSTNDEGCTGFAIFVTCDEVFAPFSNYGDIVDVIAPGVNINSTTYDGGYGTKSGTSMASPHAAGVAALVLQQNPGLSASEVEAHLRGFGQCPDTNVNGGSEDCTDQGLWEDDPDNWTEPMAHAAYATGSSADTDSAPSVSWVNPLEGDTVFGTETIQIDASDTEDGAGTLNVEWRVDGGTWQTATYNTDTLHYEDSWDTSGLTEGDHTLDAQATDSFGNTTTATITVTVDNDVDPTVSWANPLEGDTVFGTVTIQIGASDTEDGAGTLNVEWRVDGGTWQAATYNTDTGYYEDSWDTTSVGDGSHALDARATDSAGQTASASITVTVDNNDGIALSATGYKVRGLQKADLEWSGATSTNVDIYRDGIVIATTANDGAYTDNIDQRGSDSYTYKVCEAGTTTCSNEATVNFN